MLESDSIIARVKGHLENRGVAVWSPASPEAIRDAERSLGFPLPPLLSALYLNVGNGWSAPGYGFIGVAGGRASNLGHLAETYREVVRGADYLKLDWPEALLPFCEWGCNIFSCVGCRDAAAPVHRSEECVEFAEGYSLADFLTMWIGDVDLLGPAAGERATAQIVNPFTRNKRRVTAGRKRPK